MGERRRDAQRGDAAGGPHQGRALGRAAAHLRGRARPGGGRAARARRAVALLLALAACAAEPPPSFLLVTLDTTRPDHLGPYGYGAARTPSLDRLAAEGRTWQRAYATSSWTLPSHASIFTGLWPFEHGAGRSLSDELGAGPRLLPLGAEFETLAELLAGAGYRTGAVVAGPALLPALGTAQGFERYHAELDGLQALVGRRAPWVTERALEELARFGDEPYFLFVNYFDAHSPYRPPQPWDEGLPPLPEGLNGAVLERLRAGGEPAPLDDAERAGLDALRAGYDAEIAYMDHHLGRLLEAVEAAPQAGRTWVIVTSDHGESFGEHFYVTHGLHLYEDNVRVPLIVRRPGEPEPGARVDAPVQNHRLFGTILRAAGVAAPPGVDARPLAEGPVLASGPLAQLARQIRGDTAPELRAFYRPPFKLIAGPGRRELYDLAQDPGERRDLAPSRPGLAGELLDELERRTRAHPPRFRAESGDALDPQTEEALRAMGYVE